MERNIGTFCNEQLHNLLTISAYSNVNRRLTFVILGIYVRTVVYKQLCYLLVAFFGCIV